MDGYATYTLRLCALTVALAACTAPSRAQVGELLWEEPFDTLDHWLAETGSGAWGWGNGELQFYREQNVAIADVPGEPGNRALRLTARAESGPGIVDQWGNPLQYTSGRVTSKDRVSVQYGLIETRVRVPDLDLGGWPAVWMQGIANVGWPRNGELDLMEMGHSKAVRDVHDSHNGGDGGNHSTVNEMVGANAIFYMPEAVNPGNPTGAASIAWDANYARPYFNLTNPLNDRFLVYRMYWDASHIRFTVTDGGTERDLYTAPFAITSASDEFRAPFYFILNLAVGGTFTDAYNLGDPGSGAPVTMPLPAEMFVDYIRVYRWNGQGEVTVSSSTAIDDRHGDDLPHVFGLDDPFPNPFRQRTTLDYTVPEPADVTVTVYSVLGLAVETVVDGRQVPGLHTVTWDASDRPSGVYLVRLQAGSRIATRSVVVLR